MFQISHAGVSYQHEKQFWLSFIVCLAPQSTILFYILHPELSCNTALWLSNWLFCSSIWQIKFNFRTNDKPSSIKAIETLFYFIPVALAGNGIRFEIKLEYYENDVDLFLCGEACSKFELEMEFKLWYCFSGRVQ